MRWLRLLMALFAARFKSRLNVKDASVIQFRVWLTDIDASVMNHAAIMTVFEAGRIDYMVRTGFFKLARRNKWFFPSTGIHVQFFRPLKVFQKARLETRVFHSTDQVIYTEQKIIREEKVYAICVAKNKVKKGKTDISPDKILSLLGQEDKPIEASDLISDYERLNELFKERLTR